MISSHLSLRMRRARSPALCRATGSVLWVSLVCLSSLASAQSAPPATGLPEVLVTASRLPSTPSGLAQSVTVIDQQQLQEANPARLEDILNRVTGIYVDSAGKAGGFSSLYMRGAENSHLLIMIDGVKVNDPTTTRGSAYDLSSIDVSQIERIEILRGPASAIHGGEALAGVLNIITRKSVGAGVQGSAYAALGQEHYQKVGGSVGFGTDTLRAQVSAGHAADGSSGSDASLRQNTLSGNLRYTPGGGFEVEAYAHRTQRTSEAFPDDSGGPRLAVIRQKTLRDATDWLYGLQGGIALSPTLRLQASASVYDRKEHADNAPVAPDPAFVRFPVPAFVSDTDFRRTTVNATATQKLGPFASLVVGLEHQNEDGRLSSVGDFDFDGNPDTPSFGLKRSTNSVFGEGRFQIAPSVALQAGLRHDKVEGLSGETTPHLGAVWKLPNDATTLKASYGKGFKPPSFFALGFPIGGNPALRPERSRNIEVSAAHRIDGENTGVQISVFQTTIKDLVDFDGATFTNINRGTIVISGVEPSVKWQVFEQVRTQVGLTLLNIDERDGLAPLRNRPERRATAALTYDIDKRTSILAVLNATGSFIDRSNPTAGDIRLGGFTTLDASGSINFGPLQAKLAIDNVLNRYYEQFVGFPGQDRRLRIELRASF